MNKLTEIKKATGSYKMEPYKIKTVEPIHLTTKQQRQEILKKAHLNLFFIPSQDVMIDLLTDSGTGAMSAKQWAALLDGDESYAGAKSFFQFEKVVKNITGMKYVIPTHQGRAAEKILFESLKGKGEYIVSNMLFDTTKANAEVSGFKTCDLPCEQLKHTSKHYDFKGNINLSQLEKTVEQKSVAAVIITITNNSGGGQPVSLENIKAVKKICNQHAIPFILDACRFAENSYFIKLREPDYKNKTAREIAKQTFDQADLCFVSAKKDGLSNIGGFLCARDSLLSEDFKNRLILAEGFPTYGGLTGRDLAAIAVGLEEVLEEPYLEYRLASVAYIYNILLEAGIPLIQPSGGHAVYIDAKALLPHVPVAAYPGQAFVSGLYEYAGIRSCEIGSVMLGKTLENGEQDYHFQELVRLAIPRRVYTQSHYDYICDSIIGFVKQEVPKIKGVKIVKQPKFLRHFTAHFAWI